MPIVSSYHTICLDKLRNLLILFVLMAFLILVSLKTLLLNRRLRVWNEQAIVGDDLEKKYKKLEVACLTFKNHASYI